jgi:hypothetical protein
LYQPTFLCGQSGLGRSANVSLESFRGLLDVAASVKEDQDPEAGLLNLYSVSFLTVARRTHVVVIVIVYLYIIIIITIIITATEALVPHQPGG